jgi:hypothetical protein
MKLTSTYCDKLIVNQRCSVTASVPSSDRPPDEMDKHQNQIVVGTGRGENTINVHELLTKPWYKYQHLRVLYGWLCVVLMVQATNGFDGSLMNGELTQDIRLCIL